MSTADELAIRLMEVAEAAAKELRALHETREFMKEKIVPMMRDQRIAQLAELTSVAEKGLKAFQASQSQASSSQVPLPTPPKRSQAADVIAAIEAFQRASEAWGFKLETDEHAAGWLDLDNASKALRDALASFLDWREDPVKKFVRYQGVVYTSPTAGTGGYGDEHIVCFDPADVERITVDLDAELSGQPTA